MIIIYNKKVKSQYSAPSAGYCDFFFRTIPSPIKSKNLDYKILYKTFLLFFLHDSDNNRKFAADKIRKLMKEKRYPVGWHPANEEEAVARIEAIEEEYENGQYIDAEEFEKELTAQYPWLEDWKRSISIEDFRKNCKKKLKSLFLTKNGI